MTKKGSSRKTRKLNHASGSNNTNTRGALKHDALIDFPLDILCEIFKQLPPLGLLQLARTAKSFRKFLMNKASKSIWAHALSAVEDLPPCPDDLCEPQYTYLMFTNHCHECLRPLAKLGKNETLLLYLEARTQLCRACSLKHFARWQELPQKVTLALAEFVPATTHRLTKEELAGPFFKREPPAMKDKRTRFHVNTALKLYASYKQAKGAEAKKAWIEEQRAIWLAKEEHANKCENYLHIIEERERKRVEGLKERRREQIREKLRGLGWADELALAEGSLPNEAYRWDFPAKDLTEREWRSMEGRMMTAMQNRREARFKGEHKNALLKRIDTWIKPAYTSLFFSQPPGTIFPSIHEVCLTEPFRTSLCTLPIDQDLSAEMFEDAIAQLPTFVEEWRNNRIEQVLALVRNSTTYQDTPESEIRADNILPLASTIFGCSNCRQKITYPSILVHRCIFAGSWQPKPDDLRGALHMPTLILPKEIQIPDIPSIKDDVSLILLTRSYLTVWRGMSPKSGAIIKFDDAAHQHMVSMLNVLGWNPETTVQEMVAKQPYVECLCQCFNEVRTGVKRPAVAVKKQPTRKSTRIQRTEDREGTSNSSWTRIPDPVLPPNSPRKAARWIKAIQPCASHKNRSNPQPECFAKLEGEHLARATQIELARQTPSWMVRFDCFMCMNGHGNFTREGLEAHLLSDHRVEHPDGDDGVKAYVNGLKFWDNYLYSGEPYIDLVGDSSPGSALAVGSS